MTQLTMKISGMSCGHCVESVKKALARVDGVTVERVAIGEATVNFDPAVTNPSAVTEAVEDDGYAVTSAT